MRTPTEGTGGGGIRRRLIMLAAFAALTGCFDQNGCLTQTQSGPTVVVNPPPTPAPSPAPSASPTAVPGASDVDHMSLFQVGAPTCLPGNPQPADYTIAPYCTELRITATPKQRDDHNGDGKADDALNHGDDLTWDVSNCSVALVVPDSASPVFDRDVKVRSPRQTGTCVLRATLRDPAGKIHEASRTILIQ